MGWYKRFMPNFSERSSPLSDLTRAALPTRVVWTEQCESAFQDLKGAVCSDSVLLSPDFNRPFIVQTDGVGWGSGQSCSRRWTGPEGRLHSSAGSCYRERGGTLRWS